MSNYSLTWSSCGDVLAQRARTWGWALSIGAGTSLGVFPSWYQLVASLIKSDDEAGNHDQLLEKLTADFSYDALIQAAKDALNEDDDIFVQRLSGLLYQAVKRTAGHDWPNIAKALTAAGSAQLKRPSCELFVNFICRKYPRVSALQI